MHCAGQEPCFVPLLPPKETTTISTAQALDYQLSYRPAAADVVALSEVTNPEPSAFDSSRAPCMEQR